MKFVSSKITIVLALLLCLFSCEETIFEADISDQTVSLLAPSDGSNITTENVQFNWEEVTDASSYQLQIATPSFNAATQVVLDTTISRLQFTERLIIGEYQWRVRAKNTGHQTQYKTASFSVSE